MQTDDLDFDLPPELIAQTPAAERGASRLLHYHRADRSMAHRHFTDLPGLLKAGDLLVFNDAWVIPARFMLRKPTGGAVEGLFISQTEPRVWLVLLKNLGTVKPDMTLHFANAPDIAARVSQKLEEGQYRIEVASDEPAMRLLERLGRMPLPPYIRREKERDDRDPLDRERYQTVYAKQPGSIAAPTAGLHFTESILKGLMERGIERISVTLHVGLGTFKPVTANRLDDHVMHTEDYSIAPETAAALTRAKRDSRRIIAVGTTSARVLESQPAGNTIEPVSGQTSIFIRPPYSWKHVGALITNFHLPRSTLVALVAGMTGLDEQRRVYREAIEQRYRFFSYGDGMLIE